MMEMKYKVLKDFVCKSGRLIRAGSEYAQTYVGSFAETLEANGFIEKIPETPKTAWDLKSGESYYLLNSYGDIEYKPWFIGQACEKLRLMGNCFLTREEAERELSRRKAKQILLRDTKGFKPDWSNADQTKWSAYYDYEIDELIGCRDWLCTYSTIYFATDEDIVASIKTHEKEWKIYLGVEE